MFQFNKKREQTLYLVVDHTGTTPNVEHDADSIHNKDRERGFFGSRYHFVITRSGELQTGRPLDLISPLTDVIDREAVMVVLVGGKNIEGEAEDNFTDAQRETLANLVASLKDTYPTLEVLGRREVRKQRTTGPALDLTPYR